MTQPPHQVPGLPCVRVVLFAIEFRLYVARHSIPLKAGVIMKSSKTTAVFVGVEVISIFNLGPRALRVRTPPNGKPRAPPPYLDGAGLVLYNLPIFFFYSSKLLCLLCGTVGPGND